MRYHLTPARMAIIKKSTNNKSWRGYREKGSLLHSWWGYTLVQPLWKTVWQFFKKLKIELLYAPAIPLLGIYPEKTILQKHTCINNNKRQKDQKKKIYPKIHFRTNYNNQDMEAT